MTSVEETKVTIPDDTTRRENGVMGADNDRDEIKALMKELENKDLKEFVEGIAKK